ncbi:hypothetical protein SAY86_009569 [Trapa natans]|uniref:Uncharacterized protein n=1 Tax=Trapa natans TaxID=22666 RepID=A0AAN7QPV7_TRANT|nr:hypothetical protein SAY86_009569 [Trapa natans]
MDALDSSIEVLAIDYARCGFFALLNNLWTWATVAAAAIGFWRIRAAAGVTCCTVPDRHAHPHQRPFHEGASSVGCSSVPDEKPYVTTGSAYPLESASDGFEMVTKRRFTVYYDEECDSDEDDHMEMDPAVVVGVEEEFSGSLGWWSGWERALRVRNGDMLWYRCQDMTVFDGNVVRLWDRSQWRREFLEKL